MHPSQRCCADEGILGDLLVQVPACLHQQHLRLAGREVLVADRGVAVPWGDRRAT
jgi:hypothetical protein